MCKQDPCMQVMALQGRTPACRSWPCCEAVRSLHDACTPPPPSSRHPHQAGSSCCVSTLMLLALTPSTLPPSRREIDRPRCARTWWQCIGGGGGRGKVQGVHPLPASLMQTWLLQPAVHHLAGLAQRLTWQSCTETLLMLARVSLPMLKPDERDTSRLLVTRMSLLPSRSLLVLMLMASLAVDTCTPVMVTSAQPSTTMPAGRGSDGDISTAFHHNACR